MHICSVSDSVRFAISVLAFFALCRKSYHEVVELHSIQEIITAFLNTPNYIFYILDLFHHCELVKL